MTVADAYHPYLAEIDWCYCDPCYEHSLALTQHVSPWGAGQPEVTVRYWAALSERLRVLAAGEHQRVEFAERAQTYTGQGYVRVYPFGRGGDGAGIGVGGRIDPHDDEHRPRVRLLPAAAEEGQLSLFPAA